MHCGAITAACESCEKSSRNLLDVVPLTEPLNPRSLLPVNSHPLHVVIKLRRFGQDVASAGDTARHNGGPALGCKAHSSH